MGTLVVLFKMTEKKSLLMKKLTCLIFLLLLIGELEVVSMLSRTKVNVVHVGLSLLLLQWNLPTGNLVELSNLSLNNNLSIALLLKVITVATEVLWIMLSNMPKLTKWTRSLTMSTPLKNNSSVKLKITPESLKSKASRTSNLIVLLPSAKLLVKELSLLLSKPIKLFSSTTPAVSLPPLLVEKNSITVLPLLVTTNRHGLSETLGDPPGETKAMSRLQEVVRTFVVSCQIPLIQ